VRVTPTVVGRWTADRYRLEWVNGGVYHSLDAEGFSLEQLLALARSVESGSGT
jgi:hypothetical protein